MNREGTVSLNDTPHIQQDTTRLNLNIHNCTAEQIQAIRLRYSTAL